MEYAMAPVAGSRMKCRIERGLLEREDPGH